MKVRISSLTYYPDCNRRGAASLFRQEIENAGFLLLPEGIPSVNASVGTAVHSGAENTLNDLKKLGQLGKVKDSVERSVARFDELRKDGMEYDDVSPSQNTAEKQVMRMTQAHYEDIAPVITPNYIEAYLEAKHGDIMITGHPDVLTPDVRDLKTGALKRFHASIGGYSLLAKANNYDPPKRGVIDHIPRVRIKNPQPPSQSYEYDISLCEEIAKRIISRIEAQYRNFMKTGNPNCFPENPNSLLCSAKYCDAFGTDFCPITK